MKSRTRKIHVHGKFTFKKNSRLKPFLALHRITFQFSSKMCNPVIYRFHVKSHSREIMFSWNYIHGKFMFTENSRSRKIHVHVKSLPITTLCSRNFQNMKLRFDFEIQSFSNCLSDFTWNQILGNNVIFGHFRRSEFWFE